MKWKHVKRFAALALSLLLMTTVSAADTSTVVFDNNKDVVVQDLFDNFKGVMPGDERDETVTVTNECSKYDYVKVYMRAEANTPENIVSVDLPDNDDVADMNEFLAQLDMTVTADGKEIFKDSPDQQSGLTKNVYLGKLTKTQSLTLDVHLSVPQDLGNEFAKRSGEVDWIFTIEAFDYPSPSTNTATHTVQKVWVDNESQRPDSIVVNLLKNGEFYEEATLSEANQWVYTWGKLSKWSTWTVVEASVPDGYSATYTEEGTTTIITNTGEENIEIPEGQIPGGENPGGENPGGETDPTYGDYSVKKVWDDDGKNTPSQVKVTLYQGETAVESVWLGDWNNWSYTWTDVENTGAVRIVETEIPKGYVPTYVAQNGLVTITNTATLIHTGQLNWPIFAVGGLGFLFLLFGILVICKKKRQQND